ncbi:LysM peptidoglycan-binding domain-containing protein [Janibacter corallicola]|uniref:LysM peptidoglycan-binding domain-containing protein n=1 Tax=Janibacter corallicola TaxID=415212 RepID=UPI00082BEE80|nr:LysM peptidoglycan-binding domain-containing protein [Janibacter corallicola]
MTALTAIPGHVATPWGPRRPAPRRSRHLVSVPTGPDVAARPASRVRLTRRGRLAITTSTALAAGVVGASLAFAGGGSGQQVTVEPGQTLGQIAEAEMSGVPTHEAVNRIQLANDLPSAHVHAGQELLVPAS